MEKMICETKYPIFLIHGIGVHDREHARGSWGRIPSALRRRGAEVYLSGHNAFGSYGDNCAQIYGALREALRISGAQKVNIIAHSKGGLEARYLISKMGADKYVASLTTVASPHHGSKTMEWLLSDWNGVIKMVTPMVNFGCRTLGDIKPDFYTACHELSTSYMDKFNSSVTDKDGVYYQSFGAKMHHPMESVLMAVPNMVVNYFEGDNDGLVALSSMRWGRYRGTFGRQTDRGMDHQSAMDLMGVNKKERSVVPHYIRIVKELGEMGF